jgi:hypothetical protein
MRVATPLLLLALVACGSSVEQTTGGTTTSGAGGAGGSTASTTTSATSTTSTGTTCMPFTHTSACSANAQCVTPQISCTCNDPSAFSCQTYPSGQPLDTNAPGELPPDGGCCAYEGMVCGGYTDQPCGPVCTCTKGAWRCQTPDPACPPFACPTTATDLLALHGSACPTLVGQACSDGLKCGVSCSCHLDPETTSATWHCTSMPC